MIETSSKNNKHLSGGRGVARLKNRQKSLNRVSDDYFAVEESHYYDTTEFKDYCKLVYSVIGKTPLSIREIKLKLGEKLIDKWLADALGWIEDKLTITHSIPTKYSRK